MLMDGVRDVIGPTLLKDRTSLTSPCEKRDPGYPAAIDAAIERGRACALAPTGVVRSAEALFQ